MNLESASPKSLVRAAVIGAGAWGQNMLRVIHDDGATELVYVVDTNEASAASAAARFDCASTSDAAAVFHDDSIDVVYIATPPATHAALATQAIQGGKHVLVEKPITETSQEARDLIELAEQNGVTLMTGHTFMFSPPVLKLRELIDEGTFGDIFYIDSYRVNLGKYQESGVLWDLAPHDLSIILYLLGQAPDSVSASGRSFRSNGSEDVVFLTLNFPNGAIAQIHVSWLAPVKLRRTTISGSKRMAVYDDTAGPEAVKVFDYGVDRGNPSSFGEFQLSYRQGDIWIPRLENAEPLRSEWAQFLNCVSTGATPRSSGTQGMQVIAILEAAQRALQSGQREAIEWSPKRPAATVRPRFGVSMQTEPSHS